MTEKKFKAKVDELFKKGYRWMNPGRNYQYWKVFKEDTVLSAFISVFCGEKYMIYGSKKGIN